MADFAEQDRRDAVTQTLASWRIEGFEPTAEYLGLVERYIAGEVSTDDLRRYLDEAETQAPSAS